MARGKHGCFWWLIIGWWWSPIKAILDLLFKPQKRFTPHTYKDVKNKKNFDEFCPVCNANLKRQRGFDPNLNYWECKHCGTAIGLSKAYKDEYDNEDEEIVTKQSKKVTKETKPINRKENDFYEFCPDCNANLKKQRGFDPKLNYWDCKQCGKRLYSPNIYSGERFKDVYWHCDKCNSLLNSQNGFSDLYDHWKCRNCGHINDIGQDNILDEGIKQEEYFKFTPMESIKKSKYCTTCGTKVDEDETFCSKCGRRLD